MIAPLSDNAINTELHARLNNLDVNGTTFKFFVQKIPSAKELNYFLKTEQPSDADVFTKCGTGWTTFTDIQVIVTLPKNSGSEYLLNNAVSSAMTELEDFSLPTSTGVVVNRVRFNITSLEPEDIGGNVVFRKVITMETIIN